MDHALSNVLRGVGIVLLLATAGDLLLWQHVRFRSQALADRGVTTLATITGLREERSRDRAGEARRRDQGFVRPRSWDTDHVATFSFAVPVTGSSEPMMVEVERGILPSVFESRSSMDVVEIRYLPEDPTVIEVVPGELAGKARLLGWIGLGLGLMAGIFLYAPARMRRSAEDLERRGVVTTAVVETVNRASKLRSFHVRYTDGLGTEHRVLTPTVDGLRWRHVTPGATVSLRHDPQRPTNVALV
jgi:hypothetical protein